MLDSKNKTPLENKILAQIKAKTKKKGIRSTKKTGGFRTKVQLIKAIKKK
jgi:hypothetical protein